MISTFSEDFLHMETTEYQYLFWELSAQWQTVSFSQFLVFFCQKCWHRC